MAFVKQGDEQKISAILEEDCIKYCIKCGKQINKIMISADGNKATCDCALYVNNDHQQKDCGEES